MSTGFKEDSGEEEQEFVDCLEPSSPTEKEKISEHFQPLRADTSSSLARTITKTEEDMLSNQVYVAEDFNFKKKREELSMKENTIDRFNASEGNNMADLGSKDKDFRTGGVTSAHVKKNSRDSFNRNSWIEESSISRDHTINKIKEMVLKSEKGGDRDSMFPARFQDEHIRQYNILMEDTQTNKVTEEDHGWEGYSKSKFSESRISPQPNLMLRNLQKGGNVSASGEDGNLFEMPPTEVHRDRGWLE